MQYILDFAENQEYAAVVLGRDTCTFRGSKVYHFKRFLMESGFVCDCDDFSWSSIPTNSKFGRRSPLVGSVGDSCRDRSACDSIAGRTI